VRLLDNPDVFTVHASLGVPSLASRFATAPGVWNQLFGLLQTLLPPRVLANKPLMQSLSLFSLPLIRAVDQLVGATNAMRVDAVNARGDAVRFQATHADLEQCVGLATAAFALEVLSSQGGDRQGDGGHPSRTTPSASAGGFSDSGPPSSPSPARAGAGLRPGVFYPADLPPRARDAILARVKRDATLWEFEATPAT
jgi:hypothetical protein